MNLQENIVNVVKSNICVFISRFFCKHDYLWERNVYGDEISMTGKFKRSWWNRRSFLNLLSLDYKK